VSGEAPRLTTFGALMRFAASLEGAAAERYEMWEKDSSQACRDLFSRLAVSHHKHTAQLMRMVQEQLNEMVLEPISGLTAEDYTHIEEASYTDGASNPVALAIELETRLARLYGDVTARAGQVLAAAARTLERFLRQSHLTIQELRELERG